MTTSQPPEYDYTPNDYLTLSLFAAILCGIFSPITLTMSIPAVIFSLKVNITMSSKFTLESIIVLSISEIQPA